MKQINQSTLHPLVCNSARDAVSIYTDPMTSHPPSGIVLITQIQTKFHLSLQLKYWAIRFVCMLLWYTRTMSSWSILFLHPSWSIMCVMFGCVSIPVLIATISPLHKATCNCHHQDKRQGTWGGGRIAVYCDLRAIVEVLAKILPCLLGTRPHCLIKKYRITSISATNKNFCIKPSQCRRGLTFSVCGPWTPCWNELPARFHSKVAISFQK